MTGTEKKQKHIESVSKWDKENATRISLKFANKADADLIEYLEKCDNKQGEIKRLLRLAMAIEAKENK